MEQQKEIMTKKEFVSRVLLQVVATLTILGSAVLLGVTTGKIYTALSDTVGWFYGVFSLLGTFSIVVWMVQHYIDKAYDVYLQEMEQN